MRLEDVGPADACPPVRHRAGRAFVLRYDDTGKPEEEDATDLDSHAVKAAGDTKVFEGEVDALEEEIKGLRTYKEESYYLRQECDDAMDGLARELRLLETALVGRLGRLAPA